MKTVIVLLPVNERHKARLEKAGQGCRVLYRHRRELTREEALSASVILGDPLPETIRGSEKLELLQSRFAGVDPYLAPGVLRPETVLANSSGAYGKSVAEHGFALTLMLQKKLHRYRDLQKEARWDDLAPVRTLSDCTVLVVGLGDIGLCYARMVKAMGARVIGVRRRSAPCPECVDRVVLAEELDAVLPEADVVFSVLPHSRETAGLYTEERFALMKPDAVFINCGRGSAVRPEVLYRVISEHRIAAAAIDVMEPEPLPPDSPLWGLEDLVITPHVAGGHALPENFEKIVDIAEANLAAWVNGKPCINVVDRATGYRR